MRDEELFKNKTDKMIEGFIEKCEKEAAKLEVTVDYYIKEFVVDFKHLINYTTYIEHIKSYGKTLQDRRVNYRRVDIIR